MPRSRRATKSSFRQGSKARRRKGLAMKPARKARAERATNAADLVAVVKSAQDGTAPLSPEEQLAHARARRSIEQARETAERMTLSPIWD